MNTIEDNTLPLTGELLSVTFLNLESYQDKLIVHFYCNESHHWAFVRNPNILCDRLIPGAVIKVILYPIEWNSSPVLEASLFVNEDDVLPGDLFSLLAKNIPIYRTAFGFISKPSEHEGRYYAIFKQAETGMLLCSGKYTIEDNTGKCLDFDGEWNIRNGLIENYFLNRNWPESSTDNWEHNNFSISDTLDYLSIDNLNIEFRDYITDNDLLEFFYSDDWSPEFYRAQAKLGFIAITLTRNSKLLLLPQLQSSYALLDWENLTIDKKVSKILKGSRMNDENISLSIDSDPEIVLDNLLSVWGDTSWLKPPYEHLIKELASTEERDKNRTFRIWGVTLTSGKKGIPIAGELGYTIGRTYTSLSGFFNRELKEYNNFGKLQMVMLAEVLERSGIVFWNLGHPYMKYKTDLGAKIIPRKAFLKRWDAAIKGDSPDLSM